MRPNRFRWTRLCGILGAMALATGCGPLAQQPAGTTGAKGDHAGAPTIAPATQVTTFGAAGVDFDHYLQQAAQNAPTFSGGMGGGGGGATEASAATESITNNQESGVDEGGIVKAHGDHLVVLRRGRLFTIGIDGDLTPTSFVDINPDQMSFKVATDAGFTLNLRQGPNTSSQVLADMPRDACLTRDQSRRPTTGWMPVIYYDSETYEQKEGWASRDWISAVERCEMYGSNVWYDEMLMHDDTIVVLGFNYQMSATELNLFRINAHGQLSRVENGRYFLRSNDYYSSDNYASRLVDDKLVFYMPYSLLNATYSGNQMSWQQADQLPALRRGHGTWGELINKAEIYMPMQQITMPVLHTVVSCDLGATRLSCGAIGVIGSYSRNFYVAPDAVYLWLTNRDWMSASSTEADNSDDAMAFRLPLDGSAVGALRVQGTPADQFSFSQRGNYLNVVVHTGAAGQWGYNPYAGPVKVARIWLRRFGAEARKLPSYSYAQLIPAGDHGTIKNRFVGNWLLATTPNVWGEEGSDAEQRQRTLYLRNVATRNTARLTLTHAGERLDLLGDHAVVIGSATANGATSLGVSSIRLPTSYRGTPEIVSTFSLPDAAQSETRSHGFGYSAAMRLIGLPITDIDYNNRWSVGTARTVYLSVDTDLELSRAGDLAADPQSASCSSSCHDWYGNARPIFYQHQGQDRMFALMGYELIEGALKENTSDRWIQETGRVAFSSILDQ